MSEGRPALLERWLAHPRAILPWVAALVFAGAWAAARLPVEWAPSVELPAVTLSASWPGASPRAVERHVTSPLERALRGLPGTTRIESQSHEGMAVLRLEMGADRELGLYVAEVADRLAAVRRSLPDRVVPVLTHEVPESLRDEQGFLTLQLVGAMSPIALRRLAEEAVAPRLRGVPGVAGITLDGGEESELLVEVDADRLRSLGVPLDAVQQTLAGALQSHSYGWLRLGGSQALAWQPGEESLAAVAALALGRGEDRNPVHLSDVARAGISPAPLRSLSRVDGKPVVTLGLDRAPGSHLLETAGNVESAMERLRGDLPAGVELLVADDRSEDVRAELRDLAYRGGLALLSILCVLIALLGGLRPAATVLASTAAAVALALLLMAPLGLTLNLVTLAGLSLLVGLLVDNAAVMVSQLRDELRRSGSERSPAAACRAVAAVGLPLLGCTATTTAVFVPMVYLSGDLRGLFLPLAALAAATLAFSLLSALLLVPLAARHLAPAAPAIRAAGAGRAGRSWRRLARAPYVAASRFPRATLLLLFLAVGLPTSLLPASLEPPEDGWETPEEERRARRYNETIGSEAGQSLRRWLDPLLGGVTRPFLDQVEVGQDGSLEERPELVVRLRLPTGSGIERTDELLSLFEEQALASPAVRRTLARVVGEGAMLRIQFRKESLATSEPLDLRNRLVGLALSTAGLDVAVSGIAPSGFVSGVGDVSGLMVEAYGPSYDGLEAVSATFASRLRRDSRIADVDIHAGRRGQTAGREVLRLRWGPDAVERTEMSARQMAALLRAHLHTWAPTLHAPLEGNPRMPVRVVMAGADRQELARLVRQPLARTTEGALRLADLAPVQAEREPPTIEREDQQYKRFLQVYYRGPARLIRERVDREIRALDLPAGYRLERPQYTFFTGEAKREVFGVVAATLGLVFLAIAAVLESWKLAAWSLLSVPTAWIGVAAGFLGTDTTFAEGAFLGAVLTIGLAVNAGILLADRYQRLCRARPGTRRGILALTAIQSRLRPLWATTLSSVAGMLPVLLIPGAPSFWQGLAITVTGGLLASSLLAPGAMVALISWREARRRGRP